jgi:hypothetical protein
MQANWLFVANGRKQLVAFHPLVLIYPLAIKVSDF